MNNNNDNIRANSKSFLKGRQLGYKEGLKNSSDEISKNTELAKAKMKIKLLERKINYLKETIRIDKQGIEDRDKIIKDLNLLIDDIQSNQKMLLLIAEEQSQFTKDLIEGNRIKETILN